MAFEEYGKEHEIDFIDSDREFQIENNLIASFSMYRLMGKLVEVYLPKMFEVALELTKGSQPGEGHHQSDSDPRVK